MAQVLERGDIYFVYRPRVQQEAAESLADVQRSYMVLHPHGKQTYRLLVLGRKRLPEPRAGERLWGFVDKVSRKPEDIAEAFEREGYGTKTRGTRARPAARPAGEGVYAIVRHDDHTHLAYQLELPEQPGEVQQALGIEPEASYVLSVKNPEQPALPGTALGAKRKADLPKRLQARFQDRRFAAADPPDFLDYEGAEVLLIGAGEEVSEDLGIRLDPQKETAGTADILRELRMARGRYSTEPLFRGEWR
ncbi:MAG TPA: hypothetical protein VFB73_16310 [Chloroflexota bacterium]|nr:hypothetical protein [Chloroflexota bacterium]